ncbi:hypothetical protein FQA47_010948 [Oryzias melastigma]|uniref:Uncharacterized protein n=1 Tax=Oryzias melastigma TaxID=30732 RepID=A0A834F4F7_ORYME|nr:hypothetical protein FQA47_010948 [Oryzias melastigma]
MSVRGMGARTGTQSLSRTADTIKHSTGHSNRPRGTIHPPSFGVDTTRQDQPSTKLGVRSEAPETGNEIVREGSDRITGVSTLKYHQQFILSTAQPEAIIGTAKLIKAGRPMGPHPRRLTLCDLINAGRPTEL